MHHKVYAWKKLSGPVATPPDRPEFGAATCPASLGDVSRARSSLESSSIAQRGRFPWQLAWLHLPSGLALRVPSHSRCLPLSCLFPGHSHPCSPRCTHSHLPPAVPTPWGAPWGRAGCSHGAGSDPMGRASSACPWGQAASHVPTKYFRIPTVSWPIFGAF